MVTVHYRSVHQTGVFSWYSSHGLKNSPKLNSRLRLFHTGICPHFLCFRVLVFLRGFESKTSIGCIGLSHMTRTAENAQITDTNLSGIWASGIQFVAVHR